MRFYNSTQSWVFAAGTQWLLPPGDLLLINSDSEQMRFRAPGLRGWGWGVRGQKKNPFLSPFRFSHGFLFSPYTPPQVLYMEHFLFSSWRYHFFILKCFCCCLRILQWTCWDQQNHTYCCAFEAICLDKCKEISPALWEIA